MAGQDRMTAAEERGTRFDLFCPEQKVMTGVDKPSEMLLSGSRAVASVVECLKWEAARPRMNF